jgi:hypothetical protein
MRSEMLSLLPNLKTLLDSFTSTAGFMLLSGYFKKKTLSNGQAEYVISNTSYNIITC